MVLAVLAAKTGYEPDMIEMDMALETELGVDSIKRVEILSDVQKELSVEAQDVAALSRTQTVGEVVDAMIKEIGSCAPAAPAVAAIVSAPASSSAAASDAAASALSPAPCAVLPDSSCFFFPLPLPPRSFPFPAPPFAVLASVFLLLVAASSSLSATPAPSARRVTWRSDMVERSTRNSDDESIVLRPLLRLQLQLRPLPI